MDSDNSLLSDEIKRVLKNKFLTLKDEWLLSVENDEIKKNNEMNVNKNDDSDDENRKRDDEDNEDKKSKKQNHKKGY